MNKLLAASLLLATVGCSDERHDTFDAVAPKHAISFDLSNAEACLRNALNENGTLDDFSCRDGEVLTQVKTYDMIGRDGFVDPAPDSFENPRIWFSIQTQPGSDCAVTTFVTPGIGEVFTSIGIVEVALEAMQNKAPDKNVCVTSPFPAGRGTEDYANGDEALGTVTFSDMRKEYQSNLAWALEQQPQWFAGEVVTVNHSLGSVYGKDLALQLLNAGVKLKGLMIVNGVGDRALPALSLPFLWNVRWQLPETLGRAALGEGVTELDEDSYSSLMGPTGDFWVLNNKIAPREFAGWGLKLTGGHSGFEETLKANGVSMLSMISREDALIPEGMTLRSLRGDDEPVIYVPFAPHGHQMDQHYLADEAWAKAFHYILD